jgi:nitric oxide reductase subunit C
MRYRSLIFLAIFGAAIAYTWVVYTHGTETAKGKINQTAAGEGQLLYQKHNCTACHQLYGLGGYMGPDLTNVMSARGKGGYYVTTMLKYGTARMPDFHLTENEIARITAYLKCVDESGKFPIKNPRVTYWGDVALGNNGK